jgi:hypothetical protein
LPRSTRNISDAGIRAQRVLANIRAEIASLTRHHESLPYLELYCRTTEHWCEYLKARRNSEFAFLVIDHFFSLYRSHVGRPGARSSEESAPHWEAYIATLQQCGRNPSRSRELRMLYLGTRAHTRFDLAQAIGAAWTEYCDRFGCEPDKRQIRELLIGIESSTPFYLAVLDFCDARNITPHTWTGRCVRWFRPVWMWWFQGWRKAAFREALRDLDAVR